MDKLKALWEESEPSRASNETVRQVPVFDAEEQDDVTDGDEQSIYYARLPLGQHRYFVTYNWADEEGEGGDGNAEIILNCCVHSFPVTRMIERHIEKQIRDEGYQNPTVILTSFQRFETQDGAGMHVPAAIVGYED
jgi:hypothetical protein